MRLLLYIAELVLESLLLYIPFAVLHFISGNIIGLTSSFPVRDVLLLLFFSS